MRHRGTLAQSTSRFVQRTNVDPRHSLLHRLQRTVDDKRFGMKDNGQIIFDHAAVHEGHNARKKRRQHPSKFPEVTEPHLKRRGSVVPRISQSEDL